MSRVSSSESVCALTINILPSCMLPEAEQRGPGQVDGARERLGGKTRAAGSAAHARMRLDDQGGPADLRQAREVGQERQGTGVP
ncbi:unnamed protein product [Trichogramma brassicae]|uniref:Uncharacterized protein n=1 Tax=Trichogramma brassicae TaxID=86971 RepID=A0A6H5HX87_9HYME|nr:unnamed protein product [Trichogramma brassicae]